MRLTPASPVRDREPAWVARLESKIDRLLARLDAPRDVKAEHARVLQALALTVQASAFSAREVLAHAAVDAELLAALDAAGGTTGPKLGKLLQRLEGRDVGGCRLARLGADRDGVVWRIFAARG